MAGTVLQWHFPQKVWATLFEKEDASCVSHWVNEHSSPCFPLWLPAVPPKLWNLLSACGLDDFPAVWLACRIWAGKSSVCLVLLLILVLMVVVVGIISKCVGNRIFANIEHSSALLKICQMKKISSSFLSSWLLRSSFKTVLPGIPMNKIKDSLDSKHLLQGLETRWSAALKNFYHVKVCLSLNEQTQCMYRW